MRARGKIGARAVAQALLRVPARPVARAVRRHPGLGEGGRRSGHRRAPVLPPVRQRQRGVLRRLTGPARARRHRGASDPDARPRRAQRGGTDRARRRVPPPVRGRASPAPPRRQAVRALRPEPGRRARVRLAAVRRGARAAAPRARLRGRFPGVPSPRALVSPGIHAAPAERDLREWTRAPGKAARSRGASSTAWKPHPSGAWPGRSSAMTSCASARSRRSSSPARGSARPRSTSRPTCAGSAGRSRSGPPTMPSSPASRWGWGGPAQEACARRRARVYYLQMGPDERAGLVREAIRAIASRCPRLVAECYWPGTSAIALEESVTANRSISTSSPPRVRRYAASPGRASARVPEAAMFRVSLQRYLADKVQCVLERIEARDLVDIRAVLRARPRLHYSFHKAVAEQDALLLAERLLGWTDEAIREDLVAYPGVDPTEAISIARRAPPPGRGRAAHLGRVRRHRVDLGRPRQGRGRSR